MQNAKLTPTDYKKMRMRNRKTAENKYKRHLKRLSEYRCGILTAVFLKECKSGKSYYKRLYRDGYSLEYGKNYKKISNRRVRRHNGEIPGGGGYKRFFDYWWKII